MKTLGAVIAGGRSRRFGGNKAEALLNGTPLIDHVIAGLAPQVDALIVQGMAWRNYQSVADYPLPARGPLTGLCAALQHAEKHGFDQVLACGCDTLPLPGDLRNLLEDETPCVVDGQWLMGLWPTRIGPQLTAHLQTQSDLSVRHWIQMSGARCVPIATVFHNINTVADLKAIMLAEGFSTD